MRSMPAAEKSLEYVLAARWPKKTRTPMAREPDSFSVSTWPRRTTVENSSPSRTTHSAAVAPAFMTRLITSVAICLRSVANFVSLFSRVVVISNQNFSRRHGDTEKDKTWSGFLCVSVTLWWVLLHESASFPLSGSPDGQAVDLNGRNTDADWNGLSIFAAGAHPFIEFQIVAHHRNPGQHIGSVADQGCAFDRSGDLSVFDEIRFRRRENKFSVRDIHLSATEIHRVNAILHRTNDVPGIVLSREHVCVRHARHRNVFITLAASVARIGEAHQL